MTDLDDARKRWLNEQSNYATFAKLIADSIRAAVLQRGIWCETSSRAKEVHSLVKKLLKGKFTYASLPDKAGARCIVRYFSEPTLVVSLATGLFECSEPDLKATQLGIDRVGYNGIHLEVSFRRGDPNFDQYPPDRYSAELQIKTLGQHLWSEMTHDSVYKSDETLTVLSTDLKRRVHLMAGLIEVADQEFDRLNRETMLGPEAQVYKALETHYFTLTAKRPDPALSLQVIGLLLPLYNLEVAQIIQRLDSFFEAHKQVLQHIYSEAEEWTSSPLLFQPEVLMIYERLKSDQLAARKAWVSRFPESELELVANTLGISFD